MRNRVTLLAAATVMGTIGGPACAELGSDVPSDSQLLTQRVQEAGSTASGIFDIAAPPSGTVLQPVARIPRLRFGVVGPVPLTIQDLGALLYPSASNAEKLKALEGLTFFTTPHTAAEGLGPTNNQVFCAGCHENTAEGVRTPRSPGLLNAASDPCFSLGSACVSHVTRAARSTPTNFAFTSLNPATGGGRPAGCNSNLDSEACPQPTDSSNLDALHNTGKTAAFTVFGDFNPSAHDVAANPTGIGFFDPLDGSTISPITNAKVQSLGGFVQHTRPAVAACVPDPIPPVAFDLNLAPSGPVDPKTGLYPSGFRRAMGELAGPPYIGRGLIEAVPTVDITGMADPGGLQSHNSSLGNFTATLGCKPMNPMGSCITGRPNMIPRNIKVSTDVNGNLMSVTGFVGGVGRFGLRANGVEVLQFITGGLQGELSFTSLINPNETNLPAFLFKSTEVPFPQACMEAFSTSAELHLSSLFSVRNLIRNTAPPEFGDALLNLLKLSDPNKQLPGLGDEAVVQRGAQLFGIDLKAFANRMIPGRMPSGGDGLDPNAINQKDRKLDCAGCHTPVQRTGQSPAEVGAENLTHVWAPIFSDLLLHKMPAINAERFSPRPRDPTVIVRGFDTRVFETFDLARNLAQDSFTNQKASADGREFRTPPLMGLGRIGPPFLHDARVYLSNLTVETKPAGTVTTNDMLTNAPLVVHTFDDALLAAIELHDLPAPDDNKTSRRDPGAGCPVPRTATNVNYGVVTAGSHLSALCQLHVTNQSKRLARGHAPLPQAEPPGPAVAGRVPKAALEELGRDQNIRDDLDGADTPLQRYAGCGKDSHY